MVQSGPGDVARHRPRQGSDAKLYMTTAELCLHANLVVFGVRKYRARF